MRIYMMVKAMWEAVLDPSQTVVSAYRYDPFGKLLAQTGSFEQPFQFSTKRVDALTGFVYYGYRFYSPEMGRWTTRDPLGEAGGINLYAFVGNNSVNWVDPHGLMAGAEVMTGFALLEGGGVIAAAPYALVPIAGKVGWEIGSWLNERWIEPWLWDENTNDGEACDTSKKNGKKATDSSKGERHGDGGRALERVIL